MKQTRLQTLFNIVAIFLATILLFFGFRGTAHKDILEIIVGVIGFFALIVFLVLRRLWAREADKTYKELLQEVIDLFLETGQSFQDTVNKAVSAGHTAGPVPDFDTRNRDPRVFIRHFQQLKLLLDHIFQNLGTEDCPGGAICINAKHLREIQLTYADTLAGFHAFGDWMDAMVAMIVENTERLNGPLSEEILAVKKSTSEFLDQLDAWQKRASAKSTQDYENVLAQFATHAKKVSDLGSKIQTQNNGLRASLDGVTDEFKGISLSVGEIHDISEKVRMLSLNAAIEAARAGSAGRGFKVISDEIKNLSLSVQRLVKEITEQIKGTQTSLGEVVVSFGTQTSEISTDLDILNRNMGTYDERLMNYQNEFSAIVELISRTTREINSRVESLAPVFQLHDMTLQQIRHISEVEKNVAENAPSEVKTSTDASQREARRLVLLHAQKAATTDDEHAVLTRLAELYGLELEQTAANTTKIELF